MEERTTEFKKACGPDVGKFCEAVPKGKGRILAAAPTPAAAPSAVPATPAKP